MADGEGGEVVQVHVVVKGMLQSKADGSMEPGPVVISDGNVASPDEDQVHIGQNDCCIGHRYQTQYHY